MKLIKEPKYLILLIFKIALDAPTMLQTMQSFISISLSSIFLFVDGFSDVSRIMHNVTVYEHNIQDSRACFMRNPLLAIASSRARNEIISARLLPYYSEGAKLTSSIFDLLSSLYTKYKLFQLLSFCQLLFLIG